MTGRTEKTVTAEDRHAISRHRQRGNVDPDGGFFEEVEHTADMALRCGGHDLADLFRNAARGMYRLMGIEAAPRGAPAQESLSLAAMDAESLLVDWLGELVFRAESAGQVFEDMEFRKLSTTCLEAVLTGHRIRRLESMIKAVTYHRLKVEKNRSGYTTTIVFDV